MPAAAANSRLEPFRARLAVRPDDLNSAIALATGYIGIGRATADPRFTSYAQATLAPWLTSAHPPPASLVLGATALQNLHQFDAALKMLDRALLAEPANAQALLTRATILQVQGKFDAARSACRPLVQAAGQLVAVTCLTAINSLTGQLERSYAALSSVFRDDARLPASLRSWVIGALADMAERRGDYAAAEKHLLAGLRAAPGDIYLKAAYADLLLLDERSAEVLNLLAQNEQQDNLLLRLAIAGHHLRSERGKRWGQLFQARYEAARRDGDVAHLREQARFLLEVRGDARGALELAQRNWLVQKEPADVRVYLQAAALARNEGALLRIREWIQKTHYEDHTIAELAVAPDASRP